MTSVKTFYDQIQFPGPYTATSLDYHCPIIRNQYLNVIDRAIQDINPSSILDLGCGSGLITNLFAKRYPEIKFVAVDFADSINHAVSISKELGLNNTEFVKKNILKFKYKGKFDLVICQGVLHHIPDAGSAVDVITDMAKDDVILGVYHPWGKIAKKLFAIEYGDEVLHLDQELHPYERTYGIADVKRLFSDFTIRNKYPKILTSVRSLFNYRNGGLVTYHLTRRKR